MRLTAAVLTALLICVAGPCRAGAQGAQTSDYDHFIDDALKAFDAGRWAEARTAFRRAHELDPSARTLRTIGMCSFNLGDYLDASHDFDAALADTRKPLTAEQRTELTGLSERSNQRLGRFRLQLTPADATLTVDGAAPVLLLDQSLLVEPGKHELALSRAGYATEQRALVVEAGDRTTLQIGLQPSAAEAIPVVPPPAAASAPSEMPAPAATTTTTTSATSNTHDGSGAKTLAYIGLAVGGAAIVTFAITSGLAVAKRAKLDDQCPDRKCGPEQHGAVDSYDTLKTVSTVSLIAGGALLAGSVVLLLTAGSSDGNTEHAGLTPLLGLGYAGVRGSL